MFIDPYEFKQVRIIRVMREATKAVSVQLEMPKDYVFAPGQHAVVRAEVEGTKLSRQYSFSSAPSSGELWLTVTQTTGGDVSSWLVQKAKVGDRIDISKPFTGPLVQKPTRGQICMIAGGSGIAPLMSRLREQRLTEQPQSTTLFYSTRTGTRCFQNELVSRAKETISVHLSDQTGRITAKNLSPAVASSATVYICGSRSFVEDMKRICKSINSDATIYAEAFTL